VCVARETNELLSVLKSTKLDLKGKSNSWQIVSDKSTLEIKDNLLKQRNHKSPTEKGKDRFVKITDF